MFDEKTKALLDDPKYKGEGCISWTFYEDDSDFDGNDWEYHYMFDPENSEKLKALMFSDGKYKTMREWIEANFKDLERGSDFREFCQKNDIHGLEWVHEEYAGGCDHAKEF